MVANNRGKVSNLTVAPHRFIPIPFSHEQGAPLLLQVARVLWESLSRIIERPTFVTDWLPLWRIPYRVTRNYTILY